MKFILITCLLITSVQVSMAADAERPAPVLVAVAQVQVKTLTGCGKPRGDEETCQLPDESSVTFMVEYGGSCHTYSAQIIERENIQELQILDLEFPRCTRPEYSNYTTSVKVVGIDSSRPLQLANRLYVQTLFRP